MRHIASHVFMICSVVYVDFSITALYIDLVQWADSADRYCSSECFATVLCSKDSYSELWTGNNNVRGLLVVEFSSVEKIIRSQCLSVTT